MIQFLNNDREPMPAWLENFEKGMKPAFAELCASRIVYYPGSGCDGQPIRSFTETHSAHCFLYADYWLTKDDLTNQLDEFGLGHYHELGTVEYSERELAPQGWILQIAPEEVRRANPDRFHPKAPYYMLKVFERESGFDDSYGAERFAVCFLCRDGIAAYDVLFGCRTDLPAPFAVVLQDHGTGANYDKFGEGGLLELIAHRSGVYPKYLLVADQNTQAWIGYKKTLGTQSVYGGMHHVPRNLYVRQ